MKLVHCVLAATVSLLILASCSAPKNIVYFKDINPGTDVPVTAAQPIKLMPNDKLTIIVSTTDQRLNSLFSLPVARNNMQGGTTGSSQSNNTYSDEVAPYTVDKSGNIDFPVLGKIHVAGMSREEVAEYIRRELISRDLAKNPIVTVDFLNLAVSVLGEVGSPGRVSINREDFTILDALAASGDLLITGQRENIKVLRMENGVQRTYTVNINSAKDLTSSPVYYLKQNDVIYVEPNATKKRNATPMANQWNTPGLWFSFASTAMSIVTFVIMLTDRK